MGRRQREAVVATLRLATNATYDKGIGLQRKPRNYRRNQGSACRLRGRVRGPRGGELGSDHGEQLGEDQRLLPYPAAVLPAPVCGQDRLRYAPPAHA